MKFGAYATDPPALALVNENESVTVARADLAANCGTPLPPRVSHAAVTASIERKCGRQTKFVGVYDLLNAAKAIRLSHTFADLAQDHRDSPSWQLCQYGLRISIKFNYTVRRFFLRAGATRSRRLDAQDDKPQLCWSVYFGNLEVFSFRLLSTSKRQAG